MRAFWILVILLVLFAVLICYSALVVASRADEWEREEWEKPPQVPKDKTTITTCVSVPVELLAEKEKRIREQWEVEHEQMQ